MGTVSPEFVQYVNELRQDCLETATKRKAERINKTCDRILKKSTEVMEKCFHPLSVLTINTNKYENCDVIEVKSIISKHSGEIPNAGFMPKKRSYLSDDRFTFLSKIINSGFVFAEAAVKEITFTAGLYMLSKSRDYKENKEVFDDIFETLKWWEEHISLLPEDTTGNHGNKASYINNYGHVIPEITQHIDNLKKTLEEKQMT